MDRVPLKIDVWQPPEPLDATKGVGPMSTVPFEEEGPPTPETHVRPLQHDRVSPLYVPAD